MFVDTSVLIAILSSEEDAADWIARLDRAHSPFTSPLVVLETVMRLASKFRIEPPDAEVEVKALLAEAGISIQPLGLEELTAAVWAFAAYGRGLGHPAQLNLADCLSYACAKVRDVPLLYNGNDFALTDLA